MTPEARQHDTPADDTALQPMSDTHPLEQDVSFLLSDLRDLIRTAKGRAATAANVELVLLYWLLAIESAGIFSKKNGHHMVREFFRHCRKN